MAVGIYVTTSGFTTEKYNEAMSQLEAAGAGAPGGTHPPRRHSSTDGKINVFDIWESPGRIRCVRRDPHADSQWAWRGDGGRADGGPGAERGRGLTITILRGA